MFSRNDFRVNQKVRDVLTRSRALASSDQARFYRELALRSRVENWQTVPGTEGREFEHRSRLLFAAFSKASVFDAAQAGIAADLGERGCEKDACEALVQRLVSAERPKAERSVSG